MDGYQNRDNPPTWSSSPRPAPGSELHQAAILPYKLCFSCNMNQTLQQTPSSATSHTTSVPLAMSTLVVK